MGGREVGARPTASTVALVGPDVAVVLDRTDLLVDFVRQAVAEPDPLAACIQVLTTGATSTPRAFALVGGTPGGARVVVAGDLEVVVQQRQGADLHLRADDGERWADRLLADARSAEVRDASGERLAWVVIGTGLHATGKVAADRPGARDDPAAGGPVVPVAPGPVEPRAPVEAVVPASAPATLEVPTVEETILPTDAAVDAVPIVAAFDPVDLPPPSAAVGTTPDPAAPTPPAVEDDVDLSHLFETRHVGPEAAAVRGIEEAAGPVPPVIHDVPGVSGPSVPPSPAAPAPTPPPPADRATAASGSRLLRGPTLPAVHCSAGHPNAPQAVRCRSCGGAIVDRQVTIVERPTLGRLLFDDGLVVEIDRPVLIGRKPTVDGAPADPPRLVTLPDPEGALSRTHLELRLEGWEVLAVDRQSLNGTMLTVPGSDPTYLRPLEPVVITDGTVLTLAEARSCTFRAGAS